MWCKVKWLLLMTMVSLVSFAGATVISSWVFTHLHCVYTSAGTFTLSFGTVAAVLTRQLDLI